MTLRDSLQDIIKKYLGDTGNSKRLKDAEDGIDVLTESDPVLKGIWQSFLLDCIPVAHAEPGCTPPPMLTWPLLPSAASQGSSYPSASVPSTPKRKRPSSPKNARAEVWQAPKSPQALSNRRRILISPRQKLKTVETTSSTKSKGKRQAATLEQKLEAIDYYRSNKVAQKEVVEYFNNRQTQGCNMPRLNQPLISSWLSAETRLRVDAATALPGARRTRNVKFPKLEEALGLWARQTTAAEVFVTGELLCSKGRELAGLLNIEEHELNFSSGWLDGFKRRYGIATCVEP